MSSPNLSNRLSEAWNYKAPVLVSVPYFFAIIGSLDVFQTFVAMVASYCTIAGIAAFGYFINDLSDVKQDSDAGKPNFIAKLSTGQRVGLMVVILMLALLPWWYLPLTFLTATCLFIQFLLFLVYSLPPFRLKERGLFGIFTDAAYAHANPALLAALTFSVIIKMPVSEIAGYLVCLFCWQMFWGIRNILHHQLEDLDNDRTAGVKTWVQSFPTGKIERLISRYLIPLELVTFSLFVLSHTVQTIFLSELVLFPIFALVQFIALYLAGQLPIGFLNRTTLLTTRLYLVWLPLTLLLIGVFHLTSNLWLIVLHYLLFPKMKGPTISPSIFIAGYIYNEVRLPRYTLNEMVSELKLKIRRATKQK